MKVKLSVLTKRVGPFALWVWIAAGLAGLILLRHLRSSSSAGGGGSSMNSTDTGAAAALGLGSPALGSGGGDAGQPLQPDQQSPIDNSLANGGTGPAVVFDPATGDYSQPWDVSPDPNDVIAPPAPGTIGGRTQVAPPVPFGGAKGLKLTLPPLPRTTTGQTKPAKLKPKPKAKPVAHTRPAPVATQPAASSGRNQGHAAAPVARPRSSTPTKVEAIPHDARPTPPPPKAPAKQPPPPPVVARGSSRAKLA